MSDLENERVRELLTAYDRARDQGHAFPYEFEREVLRFRNWRIDVIEGVAPPEPPPVELEPEDVELPPVAPRPGETVRHTSRDLKLPEDVRCGDTPEQEARDLMERCGVEDAQAMTAGDVGPLANRLAEQLPLSLAAYERACIERAIEEAGGSKMAAAKLLGVGKSTLYRKCRQHGL